MIDPCGGVLQRERDADGRMALETDPAGRTMRWLYDSDGAHYARADRFGNLFPPEVEMPVVPNPFARALPRTSAEWLVGTAVNVTGTSRSVSPRASADLVPFFLRSQFNTYLRRATSPDSALATPLDGRQVEEDALGRKIRKVDALGRWRDREYSATGNLVAERDLDGHVVRQTTISWNLVGERRNPLNHTIRYRVLAARGGGRDHRSARAREQIRVRLA